MNEEKAFFDTAEQDVTATVTVEDFAKALDLEILQAGEKRMTLTTVNVNRLGMQLTGFFEHFAYERIQIMGEMEYAYLRQLSDDDRMSRLDQFFGLSARRG